jgi:hypothetical protein
MWLTAILATIAAIVVTIHGLMVDKDRLADESLARQMRDEEDK